MRGSDTEDEEPDTATYATDGFVVDDVGDEEEEEGATERRKHAKRPMETELSDDDFDLIQENLGIKLHRHPKQKLKRLKRRALDDDFEAPSTGEELAKTLFDDDVGEEAEDVVKPSRSLDLDISDDEQDDDGLGGFIVDENEEPVQQSVPRSRDGFMMVLNDEQLAEATEVFGDMSEFLEAQRERVVSRRTEDEDEDIEMEDATARSQVITVEDQLASLQAEYEPTILLESFITPQDERVRKEDRPERHTVCIIVL